MRLLVVSHTPHYRRGDGALVGWGPTVRELDHLASLFDRLVHLAPLHDGPPPASSEPYRAPNVDLRAVQPAGGPRHTDKLAILARYPGYLRALLRASRDVDAIHVRCPANLSMLAIVALALLPGLRRRRPWWVKYAGDWSPAGPETFSYRLQRAWLRRPWSGMVVTVNGRWPGQADHVRSFDNPCLDAAELARERTMSEPDRWGLPVRLLFVGALDRNKGAELAIGAVDTLRADGIDGRLDMVGDGPRRAELTALVDRLDLGGRVRLHGARPRSELSAFYRRAHLLLVPSRTEGWPKVIAEGMARGVVPVASAVSCIPQVLGEIGAGRCSSERSAEAFAAVVADYVAEPERWREESRRATVAADRFTYDRYLDAVSSLLAFSPRPDSSRS